MKKRKVLLSTLAAAVFATSAGALVACGDGVELPDGGLGGGVIEVTFNANGGLFKDGTTNKTVKVENGKVSAQPEAPELDGYKFTGYFLEKDGDGITNITYGANGYDFKASITVYAHWELDGEEPPIIVGSEYEITFNAGSHGTLSGTTKVTTVNGKVSTFPTVVEDEGWEFTGWQDASGNAVYASTVFTAATTVTAQYQETGEEPPIIITPVLEETGYDLYVNGTLVANLQQGTGGAEVAPDNLVWDYYAENITLEAGDQVSFTVEGVNIVSMWAEKNTAIQGTTATQGVEVQGTTVTVSVGGTYSVSFTQWLDMQEANRCVAYIGPLSETPPIVDPVGDDGLYVNGTKVADLLQGTGGAAVAPDNLIWDYYAENITLEAGDQVTFQMEGVNIVSMWAEKNTAIQGTTATQGVEIQGTTVTVSVGGTYSVSFTQWLDMQEANRCVAYIGPLSETPPIVDPVGEDGLYVNGTKVADLLQGTGGQAVAPANLVWNYYAENITLAAGDQVTFIVDGVNVVSMWAEENTAIQGTTATQGVEVQGNTLTVSVGGTYTVSFTQWLDMQAANRCVAYIGPLSETPPIVDPVGEEVFYLYGNVGGQEKYTTATGYIFEEISPDATETTVVKKYKVEVELSEGDYVKIFKTEAADDNEAWKYNNYEQEWEYAAYSNNNLQILQTGTFTFYFKLYEDGGDSVWVNFTPSGEQPPIVDPDDPDDLAVGQYIKVGDEYRKLTAGTPDSTKNEAEYYNVQLELTATTTIRLWTQSATGGVVRNINALKINGVEKFGWSQYGDDGTDHYDLEEGNYEIHYKVYNGGWVELDIAKEAEIGDAIVISAADAGKCATITIGEQTLKIYIKEGDTIVDLANNAAFRIYAWSGLNTAGYPGTVITSEMTTLTGSFSNVKFLINKGGDSTKTGDLAGIDGSNVWVITYAVGGGSVAPGVVQA